MTTGVDLIVPYLGAIFGAIATVIATYHFKGKEALRNQVAQNAKEIVELKAQQTSESQLLRQKLSSVEAELKDTKRSVRDDVSEIKAAILAQSATIASISESQGELRGAIMSILSNPKK